MECDSQTASEPSTKQGTKPDWCKAASHMLQQGWLVSEAHTHGVQLAILFLIGSIGLQYVDV